MECVFEMAWMKLFKNVNLVANKMFLIMHNRMKTWKLKKMEINVTDIFQLT